MAVSKKQAREQLLKGGQKVFQQATAEIHDRVGYQEDGKPLLERQTGAGMVTKVHQLLDPRLDITDAQRAVGNCFGAYVEEVQSGGRGKEFLREYVDSSSTGGGGFSENLAHKARMVGVATSALQETEPFTYKTGKARKCAMGPHNKVPALRLALWVCAEQRTLSQVALAHGWYRIPVKNGKWGSKKVPDRQRKALTGHLRTVLDIINDAWDAGGYQVPAQFGQIVVK
jgi:hypothetical protein